MLFIPDFSFSLHDSMNHHPYHLTQIRLGALIRWLNYFQPESWKITLLAGVDDLLHPILLWHNNCMQFKMKFHATYLSMAKLYTVKNPEFHLTVRSTGEGLFYVLECIQMDLPIFWQKAFIFKKSKIP
jgi:hypothetical protein